MILRLQLKVAQFVSCLDGAEGRELNGVQVCLVLALCVRRQSSLEHSARNTKQALSGRYN